MTRTAGALLGIALWLSQSATNGETIDIMPVWSGHPVGFTLLTHKDRQFIAFYDAERRMTIGARKLDAQELQFVRLPEKLGWDSHNYVTLAIDRNDCIHLSGNMHGAPLVYFRTSKPLDIDSFEKIPGMVGEREKHCTYPLFFNGPREELIFTYRDGGSGNGDQLYNVYDPQTRAWRRLIDGPLIDGEGETNAYIMGPTRDAKGIYHMCWVWRDTGDCATNHDLSYARSRDLLHWETSSGRPLALPIRIKTAEIVDPVPAKGGLLNSNVRLAFDREDRPVITYHKYDRAGVLQVFNARPGKVGWQIVRASDWTWRWEFNGGGSIGAQVRVYPIEVAPGGLRQRYQNARHGEGTWRLDEKTLKPVRREPLKSSAKEESESRSAALNIPPAVLENQSVLMTRTAGDLGRSPDPNVSYHLEWQTLPPNRDQPREGPPPAPSLLKLVITRKK